MNAYPFKEAKEKIDSICRKAAENGYPTRECFYTMLQENPDIACQGYNAFGLIFFWNTASHLLYGYREEEVIGCNLFDLILPQELHTFARDAVAVARKTGRTPSPGPVDLLHRRGQRLHIYSGHLVFRWDKRAEPEFYCIDIKIGN